MRKPVDADKYGWPQFVKWAIENGCVSEYEEDVEPWWDCWKTAFITAKE